ncbi:MAG: NADH:flavin oxidoreductase/NADH oxidase [Ignavibacteriales bacterium]|nr:NADH:flavin oxidoreductase/NADH oxidase [Ignavibacteriales bacterium]
MSKLFSPLKIREIEFKNRIFVSPMCQYSSEDGTPNDWHFVHLGSRAVGGAALVVVEATAVSPEGRISPEDSGIWSEKHVEGFKKITDFIKEQNSVPGIQIAHAGRKASTYSPWNGNGEVTKKNGGWQTLGPSEIPYADDYPKPKKLGKDEIQKIIMQFKNGAERSIRAGFQIIEIHMAHGYLVHEFLSPLSNNRTDEYGGSFENRTRLSIEITKAVREVIPTHLPLFIRISSTDWVEGGWDLDQSVQLAKKLKEAGADLIDCSSGGNIKKAVIPAGPNYQIPFAEKIRNEAKIFTSGVGFITQAEQAEQIIASGKADAVFLARELLRDPYWPLHAAKQLNVDVEWPKQYLRAK